MAEANGGGEAVHDVLSAVMLISAVFCIMCMFYLVNHSDMDIRYHSWNVISSTVSIFCAVLLFTSVNGVLETAETMRQFGSSSRDATKKEIILAYFFFLAWFIILQIIIGRISFTKLETVVEDHDAGLNKMMMTLSMSVSVVRHRGSEPEVLRMEFERKKRLTLNCWGTLCAHVAGFAAIHAGSELQHAEAFEAHAPHRLICCVVFQFLGLICIFVASDHIRARFGASEEVAVWAEATEEAENDIAALSLSFLAVQALRLVAFGPLDQQAKHQAILARPRGDVVFMVVSSSGFAAMSGVMVLCIKPVALLIGEESYCKRMVILIQGAFAMGFAWCLFFASQWQLYSLPGIPGLRGCFVAIQVLVACFVSTLAFVIIFVLDKIEDLEATGENADKVIRSIINAIGILVGFSWERSFDVGVSSISELTRRQGKWAPVLTQVGIATMISLGVIPAWRRYILRHVMEAQQAALFRANSRRQAHTIVGAANDQLKHTYTPVPRE